MPTTSASNKHTSASPEQVWAILSDGWRYADWVHGTKEIRAVDAGWPAVGTSIHFTAGVGPLTYKNETVSRECTPGQKLELEVHGWPAGTIRVGIRISPSGTGSVVTMNEHPLRGVARLLHNPLTTLGFKVRVKLMLEHLTKLAEAEPESNPRR